MNRIGCQPKPRAHRVNTAAKILGIGRSKTYELINDGTLRSIKLRGCRLVLDESINALLGIEESRP